MIITVLLMAASFTAPPLFALVMRRAEGLPPPPAPGFFAQWAWGGLGGTITSALSAIGTGEWVIVASFGASALTGTVLWWYSRRKRKRSLRQLGNKARARLAAMARNMPRPSPRLVPQGARA